MAWSRKDKYQLNRETDPRIKENFIYGRGGKQMGGEMDYLINCDNRLSMF